MMKPPSIDDHFDGKLPSVRATYDRIVDVSRRFGDVVQEPKKTSIHLVAKSAFAGVVTRRDKLVLTIKSPVNVKSARVRKSGQLSANRWHFEVHLHAPADVDRDVKAWLRRAYEIA